MNKMQKLRVALCACLSLAVVAPVVGAVASSQVGNVPSWSELSLFSAYGLHDTLSIPERTLSVGGKEYGANIKLEYPDGSIEMVDAGEKVLKMAGEYTLLYEAKDENGKFYRQETDFFVTNKLWSVENAKSSTEYDVVGSTYGLQVRLAKNDVLSFNKTIDLADLEAADTLLKGFVTPDTVGAHDFGVLVFTFTDVLDPTQTMTVHCSKSLDTSNLYSTSYWTAKGTGQVLGGANNGNYSSSLTNPYWNRGWSGTAAPSCSFYSRRCVEWSTPAKFVDVVADTMPFTLRYDAENVQVFYNNKMISDFDEESFHKKEEIWKGFPSGKVRLTVSALEYASETANFCISSLYGYDFTDENVFVETEAPIINVNADEKYVHYDQNADRYTFTPLAVVGGNYTVPTATAIDAYAGELKVETRVYHNYSSETHRIEYPVKNGAFAVDKTGIYAIVYRAKDFMGNVAERVYWVTAKATIDNPLTLSVDTADAQTNGVLGASIAVAPYAFDGGSGDVQIFVNARKGSTVVNVVDGAFRVDETGEWTVTYTAKDYAGVVVEKSYAVNVTWGDKPVFVDEPVLPKYFVSGGKYVVPTLYANDYSSQSLERRLTEVTVKDKNGEKTYQAGDTFIPVVHEDDPTVTLRFSVGGATLEREVPAVMALRENEGSVYVYFDKLFVGKNFTAERTNQGMTVLAAADGSFGWEFANSVVAENALVYMKGIQGQSDFKGLNVTFTDSEDANVAVTLSLQSSADGTMFAVFGGVTKKLVYGFGLGIAGNGTVLDEFKFSYTGGTFGVNDWKVNVKTDDAGNEFCGFPSGKVYISSEVVDAKAGSGYVLKQLDNNIIGKLILDVTKPRIFITGVYGGMRDVNTTYTVTKAYVSDTVDASVLAYVTVKTPDGQIASDVDGLLLDRVLADKEYVVKLLEYGQYLVEYTAVDHVGNSAEETGYAINVFDRKPPVGEVANTWSATAKVGDTVTLPEVYVADNLSATEEIRVYRYVRNPYGRAITFGYDYVVKDGKIEYTRYDFTFENVGEYCFIIIVTDGAGNETRVEYVVTVS